MKRVKNWLNSKKSEKAEVEFHFGFFTPCT